MKWQSYKDISYELVRMIERNSTMYINIELKKVKIREMGQSFESEWTRFESWKELSGYLFKILKDCWKNK